MAQEDIKAGMAERRDYNTVIPGTVKSSAIMGLVAANQMVLKNISLNKAFRITVEYNPEMLNSNIKIEYDD